MARNKVMSDNKKNNTRIKFTFRGWLHENYDDMLVTFGIVPLVIIFDDELVLLYNQTFEHDVEGLSQLVYIMSGPLTNVVYKLITKIKSS